MFTRHLWLVLLTVTLAATSVHAHQGGAHPPTRDECADIPLALAWFKLYGTGLDSRTPQDPLQPQEYTARSDAESGSIPRTTIGIAWALGAGHITSYSDFTATVRIGESRSYTFDGWELPTSWTINPYVDGWTGVFSVTLKHKSCPFAMTARAHWSMKNPCKDCKTVDCGGTAKIKSVEVRIPVGIMNYGESPVHLEYLSDQVANEGPGKLALRGPAGPNGAVVTRTDEIITTVVSGTHSARVIPEPSPEDPNRFRIEVSHDKDNPSNTVYRRATIENITLADGVPAIRYTDTVEGRTDTHVFTQPDGNTWVLEQNGLRRTTKTKISASSDSRTYRHEIEERDASGQFATVSVREETETRYEWGWETTRETLDPDGTALTTTWEYYRQSEVSAPDGSTSGQGALKRITYPTGLVRSYEYYDTDPLDPAFTRLTISRDAFAGDAGARERRRHSTFTTSSLTEREETWVNGVLVEHTDIAASSAGSQGAWRTETRHPAAGGTPLVTRYEHDSATQTPREEYTGHPDGTVEVVTASYAGGLRSRSTYRGVPNPEPSGLPILSGTEERTVTNDSGQVLQRATFHVRNGVALRIEERIASSLDALSRPTAVQVLHGNQTEPTFIESTAYGCCGISQSTGWDGITTHYFYDPLGRLRKTHRNGVATETVHDGLTTRTHVYAEDVPNAFSLATAATEASFVTRDLRGDTVLVATRSPQDNSLATTAIDTTYHPGNGIGRRVVQTLPATDDDLGIPPTVTEEFYLDGRPAGSAGPLVADHRITYGANATGIFSADSLVDPDGAPHQTTTTQFDRLGRPVAVTHAGDADADGHPDRTVIEFDPQGRPARQVDPDGVTRLWSHDPANETTVTAIDLNANGRIDPGIDEVRTRRLGAEVNSDGRVITWSEDLVRDEDSDTIVSRIEERADGLESWQHAFDNGSAATTHSLTTRLAGHPGAWDTTITHPDHTSVLLHHRHGRLQSEQLLDANGAGLVTRGYEHDFRGRLVRRTDSSGPDLDTTYVSPLVDVVATRSIGPLLTTFTHDHRGRLTVVDGPDAPDATGANIDHRRITAYWPHGAPREVTGTPGHRVAYTYDHAHRIATMTTFGSITATTRWEYDRDRGWLDAKLYDSPAPGTGTGPRFTYTAAGRLDTRTSARAIMTDHDYGPDGRLTRTSYSDGTPATVVLERDLRGRTRRLQDAGGTRRFLYNNQSLLTTVTHDPGHVLDGWSVLTARDSLQRLTGLTLRADDTDRHHVGYRYESGGRLDTVETDQLTAFYQYDAGRLRVGQTSIADTTGPLLYANRAYDHLNRLERVVYHNGDFQGDFQVFSDYSYTRDSSGLVATTTLRDGTQWRYGYHPSGELATARRFLDATTSTRVAGSSYAWTYDGIGNRLSSHHGGDPDGAGLRRSDFTPNALNQHSAIHHPGAAGVSGEAPLAAAVTVNGSTARRQGPLFHHELTADNSTGPVWLPVTIASGTRQTSGHLVVPPAQAIPAYDPEGNLRTDGLHLCAWDAENRLTQVETSTAATAAGIPYARVRYTYDSDSRLIERLHFDSPSATTPARTTRYLHAGWRRLGELDANRQLTRSLTWGLDPSGTLHLGDPSGSLLWIHDHADHETHLAHFDGNGNLTGLSSAQSRQQTAHYLYSPFGSTLAATGPYAPRNPYRFSTHHQDPVTDLLHFGFRHLNPHTGSWLSRDPLRELAGPNLYAFTNNNPINFNDALGLALYAFDGTANVRKQNTHVGILAAVYDGNVAYRPGVGTSWSGPLNNKIVGGISGAGGKLRIDEMYARFQTFYANGDKEIDIIGFSRGAALARHFANVLNEQGFIDPKTGKCEKVKIRYIGLFDTVASFGRPGDKINIGYDLDIPLNVQFVAHAVAKDEMRALFPVTLLNRPRGDQIFLEQVLPGDHSDIGGGHGEWKGDVWIPHNNLLSIAPLNFIWAGGRAAGTPFNKLPERKLINSRKPHNLALTPTGFLGPVLLGSTVDKASPVQPRFLPDGYTKWK